MPTFTRIIVNHLLCLLLAIRTGISEKDETVTTRIMPIGDSITKGNRDLNYRIKLRKNLISLGFNVDFVGTERTFDPQLEGDFEHEGHGNYKIDRVLSEIQDWFSLIEDPDVILLQIGTNDFTWSLDDMNSEITAINRFDDLITKISTLKPYTHVIAANLLKRFNVTSRPNQKIEKYFNPHVEDTVEKHKRAGRRVTFIDLNSVVKVHDFGEDNLHPTLTGYNNMADAWTKAIQEITGPTGDFLPPAMIKVESLDNKRVALTFNKPILGRRSFKHSIDISNDVRVVDTDIDETGRTMILNTTRHYPGNYTVKIIDDIIDRTSERLSVAKNSTMDYSVDAKEIGYKNNVPEKNWKSFQLVYSLQIPSKPKYKYNSLNYTIDRHLGYAGKSISRIGYYMELQKRNDTLQFIWVSMDAFTNDIEKITVPTNESGAVFQQSVSSLDVVSNVEEISGAITGNGFIEFWPYSYTTVNSKNVEGASDIIFDTGDEQLTTGSYGSMQVHLLNTSQSLFAFNGWNDGPSFDIGIGNNLNSRHTDWTFARNGAEHQVKNLDIFIVPEEGRSSFDRCEISVDISCTIDSTGSSCDDIVMDPNDCNSINVSLEFRLCNLLLKRGVFIDKAKISIDKKPFGFTKIEEDNYLAKNSCSTHIEKKLVPTCMHKNFKYWSDISVTAQVPKTKKRCKAYKYHEIVFDKK